MPLVDVELTEYKNIEQAEVLVSNLLALKHPHESRFQVPFDDVIVSLETALSLLKKAQRY